MADEKENVDETAKSDEGKEKKNKEKGGKEKKKKTWEEKQQEELKKKKEKFMPFGSDPCVKLRKKGVTKGELNDIKGSHYPWFVKPRKVQDIEKDRESKYQKGQEKLMKKGEQRFKQSNKRLREYLTNLSCDIHKRRVFEANKEPECDETYEEYLARKEKRKRMKERRKREEAQLKEEEEAEEQKQKQKEDDEEQKEDDEEQEGSPSKKRKTDKEKSTKLESWPGLYVTSATQDYITLLKYIIEAEYETETNATKARAKRLNTKNNKSVKQFKSFLNVLFTVNEMAKDNASSTKSPKKMDKRKQPDNDKYEDSEESAKEPSAGEVEEAPEEEAAAEYDTEA